MREGNLFHSQVQLCSLQCCKINKHIFRAPPAARSCMELNRTAKGVICSALCETLGSEKTCGEGILWNNPLLSCLSQFLVNIIAESVKVRS